MILIWQRWGILVFLFVPLAIGLGFLLKAIFGVQANSGAPVGVFVGLSFILSAVALYFVAKATIGKVIDKPQPAVVWQQLAEPVKNENGTTQTHRAIPVTDPDTGQQLWTTPRSTLFFIPVRFWPFILGGLGVLLFAINLIILLAQG
jgi:hypothetical protein